MVSSEDSNSLSMFNFKYKNIKESFYTIKSSVNIITHKQIISILRYKQK